MELFSVLGQYLLLAFVLLGFCYVAVFILCFPGVLGDTFPGVRGEIRAPTEPPQPPTNGKKDASQGFWISFLAVVAGLLVSSIAFALEILLRNSFSFFDCSWFPRIAFDKMKENEPLPNFFAGETFMHFNIGVGILVIFVIFMVVVTRRRDWRKYGDSSVAKRYVCDPRLLAAGLVVLVAANLLVSSHLYHRVAGVVFKSAWRVDESARQCANASHWLVFNASWAQQL